ncbi:hypothetical protein [Microbacterium sp.]|uniref:hypothetical protein n=1 Tax=Microbacterium sp. TaxID=51671 RepID=UPI0032428F0A
MTKKLTKAEAFNLSDRPDLQALVDDARAAYAEDTAYAVDIARKGAVIADRRGLLRVVREN